MCFKVEEVFEITLFYGTVRYASKDFCRHLNLKFIFIVTSSRTAKNVKKREPFGHERQDPDLHQREKPDPDPQHFNSEHKPPGVILD
jgi:hypothetical protein